MPELVDILAKLVIHKIRSIEIVIPAGPCRILSLEALIESKSALGRERDKEVVMQLKALNEKVQDSESEQ